MFHSASSSMWMTPFATRMSVVVMFWVIPFSERVKLPLAELVKV